ncbi:hypothetical protein G9A89_014346 [Geosiphon pyriformis]|nr:hypothetical protein G9A89_014346 [Geosiphon pyriformis]
MNISNKGKRSLMKKEREVLFDTQTLQFLSYMAFKVHELSCTKQNKKLKWQLIRNHFGKSVLLKTVANVVTFEAPELAYALWVQYQWLSVEYIEGVDLKGRKVVQYFYKRWMRQQKAFWERMKEIEKDKIFHLAKDNFAFVGFGNGGIYAVFAALAFAIKHNTMPYVITFGQPRIGNVKFILFVNNKISIYRVTHADDWVPSYPRNALESDPYIQFFPEYWIPLQKLCDCVATSESDYFENKPQIYPTVLKCFPKQGLSENKNMTYRIFKLGLLLYLFPLILNEYFFATARTNDQTLAKFYPKALSEKEYLPTLTYFSRELLLEKFSSHDRFLGPTYVIQSQILSSVKTTQDQERINERKRRRSQLRRRRRQLTRRRRQILRTRRRQQRQRRRKPPALPMEPEMITQTASFYQMDVKPTED